MYIADILSRSYLDEIYEEPQDSFEVLHMALEQFSPEATATNRYSFRSTTKDEDLFYRTWLA